MRRREKFVIASILLSLSLLAVQYVPLEWRYIGVSVLAVLSYLVSTWALSDDLQKYELITVVPFPTLYATSVGLFYFLLPTHWSSRITILVLFAVGMYALYLASNIFSVAKGRSIQLLHAAHAVSLYFCLIISLLFANSIFSLKLPFWANGLLIGVSHWPLIMLSLWSIRLSSDLDADIFQMSVMLTLLVGEMALVFSLLPMSIWQAALFLMSLIYIGLGVLHSYLRGRLFSNTLREFSLVGGFVIFLFLLTFPGK